LQKEIRANHEAAELELEIQRKLFEKKVYWSKQVNEQERQRDEGVERHRLEEKIRKLIERDEQRAHAESGVGIHRIGKRGKLIQKLQAAQKVQKQYR
jgi:hypothetical protein